MLKNIKASYEQVMNTFYYDYYSFMHSNIYFIKKMHTFMNLCTYVC